MPAGLHLLGAGLAETLLAADDVAAQAAELAFENPANLVLAFVGMTFEAKIAAGAGVQVFTRKGRQQLAAAAKNAAKRGHRGIISFGVAGGLASGLRTGDWVVASAIVDSQSTMATDRVWSRNLLDLVDRAHHGPIIGVDTPVAAPAIKRHLHQTTGAAAVDMESHVVARLAAAHGLAFTALRVIVDPADREIPSAALKGMANDGYADGAAVLRDLLVRPSQLSQLVRVSLDAFIARQEMLRVRRLLGPHFGLSSVMQSDTALYRCPA